MDERTRIIELKNRINEKIKEIEKDLEEFQDMNIPEFEEYEKDLEEFQDMNIPEFEEYEKDFKTKAASERYFEKIVENIIAITLLFIRLKRFSIPESEEHAFIILSNNNIIEKDFAKRLKEAKDMRNRIVHNYTSVDDIIVYHAVTEEIIQDTEKFLNSIKNTL